MGNVGQDGRPSGAALPVVDLSVIRGVGSSTVVRGSVGSYRPVIAGAKLREGTTTILPRGRARSRESACLQCAFTPLAGARRRQRWTRTMVHGKNRIPYRIDRKLTGLAEPDYDATISFGLPIEPEDSQYGKYRLDCSRSHSSTRDAVIFPESEPRSWNATQIDLGPLLDNASTASS